MKARIPQALIALLVLVLPAWNAQAQTLELELTGLSGELRDNARAWLGDLPDWIGGYAEMPWRRSNFVLAALDARGPPPLPGAVDLGRAPPRPRQTCFWRR